MGGWGDITQTRNVFVSQLLFLLVFPPFPSPQVQRVSGRKMSRQSHSPSSVNFNASSDKLRQSATRLSNVTHTLITHIKLQEAISSVWKRGGANCPHSSEFCLNYKHVHFSPRGLEPHKQLLPLVVRYKLRGCEKVSNFGAFFPSK